MRHLLTALLLITLPAVAEVTLLQPNTRGGFSGWSSAGGVTQVVPGPGDGYTAYSEEGFTTYQPNNSGGVNYYGTEDRNGFVVPAPGDGFTVYEH